MLPPPDAPAPTSPQAPSPRLTPSFCLTPTALAAFLSRARAAVDDPIGQHLSALSVPSRTPFQPAAEGRSSSASRQLAAPACSAFVRHTLFPAWRERDRVLQYCEGVAEAAEAAARAATSEPDDDSAYLLDLERRPRSGRQQQEEPDERLDPYSARVQYQLPESNAETLRRVLTAERGIERVVRSRTWAVVVDRCAGIDGGWSEAMRAASEGS